MSIYAICTDADYTEIKAVSIDAAAREWATSEGYVGVRTAVGLLRRMATVNGAWMWIDGPNGRMGGSTEDSLREYLHKH